MPDLAWVPQHVLARCERRLGSSPAGSLMEPSRQMSDVYGLLLEDGRHVAVKVRDEESGRARSCVRAQLAAAEQGFACAEPITDAEPLDGAVVHAEVWRPGGIMLRGDDPQTTRSFAELLALAAPRYRRWRRSTVHDRFWKHTKLRVAYRSPRRKRKWPGLPACGQRLTMPEGNLCSNGDPLRCQHCRNRQRSGWRWRTRDPPCCAAASGD